MSSTLRFLLLLALPIALVGCPTRGTDDDDASDDDDAVPVDFAFSSTAFEDGDTLPAEYECYNTNPELVWEGVPEGTVALAMIMDDPTGGGNFPHWAIYNMAPDSTGIPKGASGDTTCGPDRALLPDGSEELRNGFEFTGYLGSCACGFGPNTYRWRLWALDAELDDPATGDASDMFSELAASAEAAKIEVLEFGHSYGPATPQGCQGTCAE
jgi:Raf kinase inhibitor-like YbhB/YbcL family protein